METRNEEATTAGRIIYGSMTHVNTPDTAPLIPQITVQHGANSQHESVEESVKRQPMSPLRRAFCLVLTFDVIITLVLWLLFTEIQISMGSENEFISQVVNYDFKTSLFDTVWLSLFRFTTLILAYGLYRSKVPWFVAVTTAVTCIFMICKIIYFDYDTKTAQSPVVVLDYIELVAPIVLSWVEVWLMDLKVIPEERRELESGEIDSNTLLCCVDMLKSGSISSAFKPVLAAERRSVNDEFNERAPLLSRFLRAPRTEQSFYSPQPSEDGDAYESDDSRSFHSARTSRTHSRSQSGTHSITSSTSQGAYYKSLITNAQTIALDLIESDGWTKEAGKDEVEGIVYTKHTKDYGKVFKLIAEVDVDALTYFNDIVENASAIPTWNPTVLEVRTLEIVSDNTEISYNVAAEGAGGMVSSRDFVCVRHWEQLDGWYISSSTGAEHPSMPPQAKHVRGEQHPGIMRLKDVDTNKHRLEWLLNTNLKGWLPQYLIDQALSGVMIAYLKNLRKHAASLSVEREC